MIPCKLQMNKTVLEQKTINDSTQSQVVQAIRQYKKSKPIPHWAILAKSCQTRDKICGAQLRVIATGQHSCFLNDCSSGCVP